MSKRSIIQVEDNAKVRKWSEDEQKQKDDSIAADHEPILCDDVHIHLQNNNLQELKETWDQLDTDMKLKF
ncbi:hypothetical protein HRI_005200900 [Hibiscus trionum]|uniref:Uncharacterized protein n=1 Tax=Hibiscus trionum TaxID=183268 RepID=A0A9W7JKZ7_HIBTR|nr:hypothetical protein HRI_005200900 [Hibiscus trionum]